MLPAQQVSGHDSVASRHQLFQKPPSRGSRSAAAAEALSGLRQLAESLALDDRGRKAVNLQAIADLAEVLRLELIPELEASARSFDLAIARAALEALGALSLSASAAGRLAELGGAA